MKVSATQSCPTLCNPVNYSQPGSCVHAILQARTGVGSHSLSKDLPDPGIEPGSSSLLAEALSAMGFELVTTVIFQKLFLEIRSFGLGGG